MKKTIMVLCILALSASCLVALLLHAWANSPFAKYKKFLGADRAYYSRFADACDLIMQKLPPGMIVLPCISGSDASLPPILKNLRADSFYVSTNQVLVRFGVGRISSSIIWEPDSIDLSKWELVAVAGEADVRKTVFSRESKK